MYFPRINGRMEWTSPDGSSHSASFDDQIGRTLGSQRLRTALDLSGEWLPAVLSKAHHQLMHLRRADARAGGMVIAIDQDHARGIARILKDRLGVRATVATSDDPDASKKIAAFHENDSMWLVAVRMVSEGVDIPRLRVGVYATNTVTDLFFRQAVGRLVRVSGPARHQRAYMFIPDDLRLRDFALRIAEQRRHSLRKPDSQDDLEDREEAAEPKEVDPEDQLSLFSAIAAVPLDEAGRPLEQQTIFEEPGVAAENGEEEIPDLATEESDRPPDSARFSLTAPTFEAEIPAPTLEPDTDISPRSRKRKLRELNSARVRILVHRTRQTHAKINADLNRIVGIARITEATVSQLDRRLDAADQWIKRIR